MKLRRPLLRPKFVAIAALFVVASVGMTLLSSRAHAVVDVWDQATTRQSERYSSLSFLDTGHLPTYAPAGVKQHMMFRIVNHETAVTTYAYRAILSTGSTATVIKSGTVTLTNDQLSDQALSFTLLSPNTAAEVMVQLVDRPEYITFEVKS